MKFDKGANLEFNLNSTIDTASLIVDSPNMILYKSSFILIVLKMANTATNLVGYLGLWRRSASQRQTIQVSKKTILSITGANDS